jgi:FMN-dependent oxidoreductase (nitrilotriacetate monooxygenase family)
MMKLGFFYWPCGHHIAAWRHPRGTPDSGSDLASVIELAGLAERGLFDLVFMADSVTFWRGDLDAMTRDSWGAHWDPFTLMCALSQHTRHIGLVCTATTTYDFPYSLARRFAALDLISGGRAGWNLVTSGNRLEADSFGFDRHPDKDDRYARAREFAHAVRGLWNSWDADAFVRDRETGLYFDKSKMRILQHSGTHYRVKGPMNVPPSPQGEPVMVQAGASEEGRALAAATAEVVFGAHAKLESAQEYYADVKGRMRAIGRDPDSLKIMPGLTVYVGRTSAEGRAKLDELQDLIDPRAGLQLLSARLNYDLSGHDIDGPLPDIPRTGLSSSRIDLFIDMARRENLTIRDLYRRIAGARGHMQVVGSVTEVVDLMEQWVTEKGCDGFNIMPPVFPESLVNFVELVVPELQRRGLYRTKYEGTTLRANLGITRPAWNPAGLPYPARAASGPA